MTRRDYRHQQARRAGLLATLFLVGAVIGCGGLEEDGLNDEREPFSLTSDEPIQVSGHYLVGARSGQPLLLLGDTAWTLPTRATRAVIVSYLDTRKAQGFNTVMVTFDHMTNVYGRDPFARRGDGKWDVTRPLVSSGSSPGSATEYDYWDHALYAVDQARARGLYVLLSTGASPGISGAYNGDLTNSYIDTPAQAYAYGRFLGGRLRVHLSRMFFVTLDDRAPVYGSTDRRAHYDALAEGIADGAGGVNKLDGAADFSKTFITAFPRKPDPSSSAWFQNRPWLSVNSIQAGPADAISRVSSDFARSPVKPSWVIENRYENYTSAWDAWSQRYQIYLALMAGGFSAMYGEDRVWAFQSDWASRLQAPAAIQMKHLLRLMAQWGDSRYLSRQPDASLVVGAGSLQNTSVGGDRQQASRSADRSMAMVYAMNGRDIRLRMSALAGPTARAWWFSPRDGLFHKGSATSTTRSAAVAEGSCASGGDAPEHVFDPPGSPGNGNDWVLVVESGSSTPAPPPVPTGLLARWSFDEGSGTTARDSSGNDQHGTLRNGASYTGGRLGTALAVDGVDDRVTLPGPILANRASYSLSAWFRTTSNTRQTIYNEHGASGPAQLYLNVNENVPGDIELGALDDAGGWTGVAVGARGLNDGAWHHVAVVQRPGRQELFLDGTSCDVSTSTPGAATLTAAVLASRQAPSSAKRYFAGSIDEVRLYERALSAGQVAALAQGREP